MSPTRSFFSATSSRRDASISSNIFKRSDGPSHTGHDIRLFYTSRTLRPSFTKQRLVLHTIKVFSTKVRYHFYRHHGVPVFISAASTPEEQRTYVLAVPKHTSFRIYFSFHSTSWNFPITGFEFFPYHYPSRAMHHGWADGGQLRSLASSALIWIEKKGQLYFRRSSCRLLFLSHN